MLTTFQRLARVATDEFSDIVTRVAWVGGTPSNPNKLRLLMRDESFMDVWLSDDGDYAYHWEQRRQSGKIYRWDNALIIRTSVHFPIICTMETTIRLSQVI
ncbi:MAG: hypothetical protein HZB51_19775 [Chloroflexi bacterium]|nr:hypothetical protein [Chloroflexota bacterium]